MKLILSLMIVGLIIGHVSAQQKTVIGDTTAQPVQGATSFIKVTEIDEDGKRIEFKPGYVVVDPNSKLELQIDKAALASQDNSTFSQDITTRIKNIKTVLMAEKDVMAVLDQALAAYRNPETRKKYFIIMQKLRPLVDIINRNPAANAVRSRLPTARSLEESYLNLLKIGDLLLKDLQDQLLQEAKKNGTVVQLGAWLETQQSSTPIHIPGFDTYDPQKPTTVERFQITLTAEQKKELQDIADFANAAKEDGLPAVVKKAEGNLIQLIGGIPQLGSYDTLKMVYDKVKTLAQNSNAQLGGLKADFDNLLKQLDNVKDLADGVAEKYKNTAGSDNFQLLTQVNADADQLIEAGAKLKGLLVKDSVTIHGRLASVATNLRSDVAKLLPLFPKLYQSFISDFKNIQSVLDRLIIGGELVTSAYDFTEKVKQLSFDNLPAIAVIDLNTAGSRNLGDQVTIKLASGPANQKLTERELLHYRLYFCKVYARTAVGFLFVSPTPSFKRSDDKAFFRYAPSYSILLKGFWKSAEQSRQSLNYHKLYGPGVGLNFSGLDFNGDGSVELGVGGVFTIFQDFLQLGYGINTESGRGYALFGFKLPVGSFNIH